MLDNFNIGFIILPHFVIKDMEKEGVKNQTLESSHNQKESIFSNIVDGLCSLIKNKYLQIILIAAISDPSCANSKFEEADKDNKPKNEFIYYEPLTSSLFKRFQLDFENIQKTGNYRQLNRLLINLKSIFFDKKKCTQEEWDQLQEFRKKVIQFAAQLPAERIEEYTNDRFHSVVNFRDKLDERYIKRLNNMEGVYQENDNYYFDLDGEKWQITGTSLAQAKVDNEDHYMKGMRSYIFSLVGYENEIYFLVDFYNDTITIEKPDENFKFKLELLRKKRDKAKRTYKRQEIDKMKLQLFDLPYHQEIGYVSILPKEYDRVIRNEQGFRATLPTVLMDKGYDINKTAMDDMPFIETENPIEDLDQALEHYYNLGIRYFYIDLNGHSDDMKRYDKGIQIDGEIVNAEDLIPIIKKYPDCEFVFTTISCNGGYLRDDFMDFVDSYPEFAEKIRLFIQSKPTSGTPGAALYYKKPKETTKSHDILYKILKSVRYGKNKWNLENYSTFYNIFFIKFLLDGETFGSAAYLADIHAQYFTCSNPEAIVDGVLIL